AYEQYEDEEGNEYQDQNSNNYIDQQISSTPYSYDLWFTYYTFAEGAFLGPISAVEDIPALLSINDYFVWSGSQTESSLSITGEFLPGRLYKFIGTAKEWQWEEDTDIGHNNTAMGDILNVATADLQKNNSRAYAYLDHLTSNQIFTDRLIANEAFIENLVANEAFINKLFANEIIVPEGGSIHSEDWAQGSHYGFNISADGTIEAYQGRFAAGLGQLIAEGLFSSSSSFSTVELDDIETIAGLLVVFEGDTVKSYGSDPFRVICPVYDKKAVYFYAYNNQLDALFGRIECQDRSSLLLTKLAGDSLLYQQTINDDKIITITNSLTSGFQRHYKVFNLKIFTSGWE
ncbi:MAG: hypothetical protein J6W33_01345, partial [Spirochaetia bacterium]|nr:hypothetical protein [Spirochaetia bacterium]